MNAERHKYSSTNAGKTGTVSCISVTKNTQNAHPVHSSGILDVFCKPISSNMQVWTVLTRVNFPLSQTPQEETLDTRNVV